MSPVPEEVLVVPRTHLFPAGGFHGFSAEGLPGYLAAIAAHAYFAPRARVEDDPGLKQIIPYVVLRHQDRIFLVRRYLSMDVIFPYVVWITLLAVVTNVVLDWVRVKVFTWSELGKAA